MTRWIFSIARADGSRSHIMSHGSTWFLARQKAAIWLRCEPGQMTWEAIET